MQRLIIAATLFASTAAQAALMGAQPETVRVRGDVVSATPAAIVLKTRAGTTQTLALAPGTTVSSTVVIGIDAIKPNSFIGTTAEPGKNGKLTATEVHVFPEAMRGLGEGHYPWDTSATSSMTNGNVRTVGRPRHGKGRDLIVDYKGGQQAVAVPASVPIVSFGVASFADLKPGAHVFAVAQKGADGSLATNRLVVGANGSTPPM